MKNVETAALRGRALDWAIAKILNREELAQQIVDRPKSYVFRPSSEWLAGGPLIEVYKVNVQEHSIESLGWLASIYPDELEPIKARDKDPLVAICRAIVSKEIGTTVEIPDEIAEEVEQVEVANG